MSSVETFKLKVFGRKQKVNVITFLEKFSTIPDNCFYVNIPMAEFNAIPSYQEKLEFLQKQKFFESSYKARDNEFLRDHPNRTYVTFGD